MSLDLTALRLGYTSFSPDHKHPGDRRRFPRFAQLRGTSVVEATPDGRYDAVLVTQAADVTRWSRHPQGGAKIIYDLTDSYLSIEHTFGIRDVLRGVGKFAVGQTSSLALDYRKAMIAMCRRADAVVCSTPEQAEVLRQYNEKVFPILDFTSVAATDRKTTYAASTPFRLVWEGQGGTAFTLETLAEPVRALQRQRPVELHLVTDLSYAATLRHYGRRSTVRRVQRILPDVPVYFHEWHEGMLGRIATACDLAVLPLPDRRDIYWYKPENRLLLFWRMGVPTLTSATPAYERVMRAANQENYCRNANDWTERLSVLASSERAREAAGSGGRQWVESTWSEAQLADRWDAVIEAVLPGTGRRSQPAA